MLLVSMVGRGQIRGNNITVAVTPDHRDWTYRVGEKMAFTVSVMRSGTLVDEGTITYEMGPEMYATEKRQVTLHGGQATLVGRMMEPGFYRVRVTTKVGGRDYEGLCTAAVSPERIEAKAQCPEDFDAFWQRAAEEARWTALEPKMELLPERCMEGVNVYHVSYQNDKWGRRVYGILCVPTKAGRYPALLRVPGAGVRPYGGDAWLARKGCIVLEIGIHGVPVTREQTYYDELQNGPLDGYFCWSINDRDRNYYKHVVTGCLRSIDYIATLPEWDGEHLGVTGSSQGGFLSLVCAALDKRVTCYGAVHAALCDHEASLAGRACGWPHYWYGKERASEEEVRNVRYYDGVNFARRITCPGWFSFGYNDTVVPPTTAWATYNSVTAPKEISIYQQTGHYWYQEQWDEWGAWLEKALLVNRE